MAANGVAAANRMRGFGPLKPGMCLFYVWQAYKAEGASTDRGAGTALEGWNKSEGKHEGDRNPPAGVPVWWGAKPSSSAGDVVISLGNGRVIATDQPRYGVIGEATIAERERLIGRPYLGWTETILGAPIEFDRGGKPAVSNPGETATPEVPKEDSMPASVRVNMNGQDRYYNVDHEYLKHCGRMGETDIVRKVFSPTDELHVLKVDQFWDLLDGLGIPRSALNAETGAVWNPQANNNAGAFEGGGVWSRSREAVAIADRLAKKA